MGQERLEILGMVESGQISVDEATRLLAAVPTSLDASESVPAAANERAAEREAPGARYWLPLFLVGLAVLLLGLMLLAFLFALHAGFALLLCGWVPVVLGLVIAGSAVWSRQARWLQVRVYEEDERKLALCFPVPLTLAAWGVRVAEPFVPQLRDTGVDEVILSLRDGATRDEPMVIEVRDDEDGERIELYLG